MNGSQGRRQLPTLRPRSEALFFLIFLPAVLLPFNATRAAPLARRFSLSFSLSSIFPKILVIGFATSLARSEISRADRGTIADFSRDGKIESSQSRRGASFFLSSSLVAKSANATTLRDSSAVAKRDDCPCGVSERQRDPRDESFSESSEISR